MQPEKSWQLRRTFEEVFFLKGREPSSILPYAPEIYGTRKEVPGKGDSFWKPSFSGSMLNLVWGEYQFRSFAILL